MNTAKRKLSFVLLILFAIIIFAYSLSLTKVSAMQLFFRVLNGENTNVQTLEVEPNTSIDEIRAKVQEKTSIPQDKIVILFAGKVVTNGKTLSDYNIQKESTLQVIIRTESNSCHGTENCTGIYINSTCTECEKDISIYYTPPAVENESNPSADDSYSCAGCAGNISGNYLVFTALTCFAICGLVIKSRKN